MNDPVEAEREACIKLCCPTTMELLQCCGEMTAQELRTVRAVLDWIVRKMESRT